MTETNWVLFQPPGPSLARTVVVEFLVKLRSGRDLLLVRRVQRRPGKLELDSQSV